ncbi:adenylate kinase isoenzyme 5 isoform X1 [Mesocricetus auratus]|uniref:Adenylate kinase isoenzyme 5 n=1 Tax=Mesocricetus auratus TaxID=10036 RepID=A0A1U7QYE2_MESAU|nr:adenylate kinase isoenzyme 5 isoform X1 [Mesocricetus auratus]
MNTNDAKEYLARRDIPQLFESLLNGLMCSKPEDPVEYLESCLQKVKELGGCDKVKWDTFVSQEKKTLPPLNGGQSRRSFLRNVMPENSNFPYRRYDRLPPIHQFSIESDTDLSETAELIEEYEVFDPTRPRPKIILVIGGPGSGKGTQSLKIAERYGFQYISVGELLRKKIHSASSNRKWSLIAKIITNGELAPQETTITEIKQKLMQIPDEEGIVIDGFPRDVAQALSFEDQICTPDLVVFLACANQRLRERLAKRAEQQGRPDDNLKATQRRLVNFKQNAAPLVKYFQEKGLIMTFDADRDEDAVFYDISVAVDNKLFANKEAATDSGDLDPLMFDAGEIVDTGSDYDDQGDDQLNVFGEDTRGGLMEDLRKCKIIFLMGGPGSGKGTQCEKLAEKYGFTQLSTGELLRQELASESERSRLIRDIMERGDLVPSGVILELLKEAMVASLGNTKGFLIDGYPREVKQGEEFGRRIGDPHLVICMDCSADTMTNRLLQRSQSSQRGEDTAKTIAKRLEAYHRASIPVIAYYETKTQLRKVNAEGTPDQVFLQLCTAIDSVF